MNEEELKLVSVRFQANRLSINIQQTNYNIFNNKKRALNAGETEIHINETNIKESKIQNA